jgi:hypothetical protein
MFLDAHNLYSDEQAVTAAAASTNLIDHGQARKMGTGKPLYIVLVVDVAMTDAGSDSTVAVTLETDDNESFTSATSVQTLFTIPATSAIGTRLVASVDPGILNEQYSRLYYTPANGNLTTGSFTAAIVTNIEDITHYPKGYTIS